MIETAVISVSKLKEKQCRGCLYVLPTSEFRRREYKKTVGYAQLCVSCDSRRKRARKAPEPIESERVSCVDAKPYFPLAQKVYRHHGIYQAAEEATGINGRVLHDLCEHLLKYITKETAMKLRNEVERIKTSGSMSHYDHKNLVNLLVVRMKNKGNTYSEIANFLNERKVDTFSHKGLWSAKAISDIWDVQKPLLFRGSTTRPKRTRVKSS